MSDSRDAGEKTLSLRDNMISKALCVPKKRLRQGATHKVHNLTLNPIYKAIL